MKERKIRHPIIIPLPDVAVLAGVDDVPRHERATVADRVEMIRDHLTVFQFDPIAAFPVVCGKQKTTVGASSICAIQGILPEQVLRVF